MNPEQRRHPEQLAPLLDDDFVEHGSSGRVFTKSAALAHLRTAPDRTFVIEPFHVRELAPGCALTTFRLLTNGAPSLRASIWRQQGTAWAMVFHQGTLCLP